jgi:hypothetical protein
MILNGVHPVLVAATPKESRFSHPASEHDFMQLVWPKVPKA